MRKIKGIYIFSMFFYTENKQIDKVVTSKAMTYGKKLLPPYENRKLHKYKLLRREFMIIRMMPKSMPPRECPR